MDLLGLGAAVIAVDYVKLDLVALGEGAVAIGGDGGLMDEEVFAAFVRFDEAVALLVAEPSDLAGGSQLLRRHE